jgi:transcriptional regulator with XRE-family HTH domain
MKLVQQNYVPGTSRAPRSGRTLALRMALELQHQHEVAERIKRLRGKVPQPIIAERVGVTLRAYQEWEAGGGLKWENYGKLALALGTTVEYLMHGTEETDDGLAPHATQLDLIEAKLDDVLAALTRLEGERLPGPPDALVRPPEGQTPNPGTARRGKSRRAAGSR